jgi:predicted metal-dependent TIM-barrel fold hydrolase
MFFVPFCVLRGDKRSPKEKKMRMIDPHIHTVVRTIDDYRHMAQAGIVACVEPSFWSGIDRRAVASFEDYWEQTVSHESARAEQHGIRHFAMVGVNPKEARSPVAMAAVDALEPFLERPQVIGIGEIGFDLITDAEEEVFRRQLRLAVKRQLPVIVHLPHQDKMRGLQRTIAVLEEEGADPARIIIDHNTEETVTTALATGCWVGLTVYYVSKLSAERAIAMLTRNGCTRMIINGSADWGWSDPLAVPKVATMMAQSGRFTEREIAQVVYDNPVDVLSHSPHFSLWEEATPKAC